MLEAIGKELKLTRIKKDLTMSNVSDALNFNIETLRRYEKNASGLSIERLEELLNYYKVDKSIFFKNVCEYMHTKIVNNEEE